MREENQSSLYQKSAPTDCTFCQPDKITDILKITPHFLLVADHAPLVEGHLLIIPRQHYACYGDMPEVLDAELFALKDEMRQFYQQFYAPVVFWEHGVFRQTVFHAHLHCFPWGDLEYDLESKIHSQVINGQDDIRAWYHALGHYFYLEDAQVALLFAPETDRYMHVVQQVFQKGLKARGGTTRMRPPQQRQLEGQPFIAATRAKWQAFQGQQVH